jgi:hypothetical protein
VPFRVFGHAARRVASPPQGVLSESAARPEFHTGWSTAVIGSTIPLCRWPFPRLCGFPPTGCAVHVKQTVRPLFEFSLPPECCPAKPSPPAEANGLLSWASAPYSTSGIGGPLSRALPQPATFRLQGLVTLLTAYSLRARAGSISHRQRSWDSPFGAFSSRKVSAAFANGRTHIPFNPSVLPPPKRWAGPNGPRLLGFDPSESPSRPDGG